MQRELVVPQASHIAETQKLFFRIRGQGAQPEILLSPVGLHELLFPNMLIQSPRQPGIQILALKLFE